MAGRLKFLTGIMKLNTLQVVRVSRRSADKARRTRGEKINLEIWDKAQREFAWRRKSD